MSPIAWLVERDGAEPKLTFAHVGDVLAPAEGLRVTPLVAAPPAQAVAEVEAMLDRYTALCAYGELSSAAEDAEAADLYARLLSIVSCAAPPEGAPSYTDLADALRAWEADCAERISLYGEDFKALKPEQRHLHEQTSALLSRIPQHEEGTDR